MLVFLRVNFVLMFFEFSVFDVGEELLEFFVKYVWYCFGVFYFFYSCV